MKMNRTNGLALILIACGILIFLNQIGFGGLKSFLIPVALMFLEARATSGHRSKGGRRSGSPIGPARENDQRGEERPIQNLV
jgi:hypothetical protein